jgi:hypothetical protein
MEGDDEYNSKHEIRNSKQIQMFEIQMSQKNGMRDDSFWSFGF